MDMKLAAARLIRFRGDLPRDIVARAVAITEYSLELYETARRVPRDEVKLRLAQYYHTSVGELFFAE